MRIVSGHHSPCAVHHKKKYELLYTEIKNALYLSQFFTELSDYFWVGIEF